MTHVTAYTYEADYHCLDCAKARFQARGMDAPGYKTGETDQHHIPYKAEDSEGNPVHPVFSTDELPNTSRTSCGTCREIIDALDNCNAPEEA